jgi:hypothetical protein
MKNLIEKTFKELLNMEVRVINLPQDDIDMAIYVVRDKKTRKMSEKELATFGFDYAITRTNKHVNNWVYIITVFHDAVFSNNELVSPPDSSEVESVNIYKSSERALADLIVHITKNNFELMLMEWEMEEAHG